MYIKSSQSLSHQSLVIKRFYIPQKGKYNIIIILLFILSLKTEFSPSLMTDD